MSVTHLHLHLPAMPSSTKYLLYSSGTSRSWGDTVQTEKILPTEVQSLLREKRKTNKLTICQSEESKREKFNTRVGVDCSTIQSYSSSCYDSSFPSSQIFTLTHHLFFFLKPCSTVDHTQASAVCSALHCAGLASSGLQASGGPVPALDTLQGSSSSTVSRRSIPVHC